MYVPTATPDGTGDGRARLRPDPPATGGGSASCSAWLGPDFCHPTNTYASCTPVATAEAVFAHFGKYGTARLDPAGRAPRLEPPRLRVRPFPRPGLVRRCWCRGRDVSPRLIVPFDGVGDDDQFVVALDAATGKTLWRYDRPGLNALIPDKRKAYGTPVLSDVGRAAGRSSPPAPMKPSPSTRPPAIRSGGRSTAA